MCTNFRPLLGRYRYPLYLKCGYCPACLQEKAIRNAQKIKDDFPYDGHPLLLFITLTYDNRHVPYIDGNDLSSFPIEKASCLSFTDEFEPSTLYKRIPIYRNCHTDFLARGKKRVIRSKRVIHYQNVPLDQISDVVPSRYLHSDLSDQYFLTPTYNFKRLQSKRHDIKLPYYGVPFYPDVQLFMKRLRINLFRHYGFNLPLKYFFCTELGPETHRPHVHGLLSVPQGNFAFWQRSIAKAWPFARYNQTRDNVQIAINAASYVASYVSSITSLPDLFRKTFRPCHHHSKGFGFGRKEFTFESVLKAFRDGDLRITRKRTKQNASVDVPVLLPKYVIYRYFPKCKGFACLTSDEIVSLYSGLRTPREFAKVCRFTEEEVHALEVLLRNKRAFARSHGVNSIDYGIIASRIWTLYNSNLLIDFYQNQTNTFESYDNISFYLDGAVRSPSLDSVKRPLGATLERDPNKFRKNISSTINLVHWYNVYNKCHKLSNNLYIE